VHAEVAELERMYMFEVYIRIASKLNVLCKFGSDIQAGRILAVIELYGLKESECINREVIISI